VETPTSTHSETRTDEPVDGDPATDELVAEELLVEEVSIDGMCGVY
jgi:mycofactocin precursor